MSVTWHYRRPINFRSTSLYGGDVQFPRAVAGEDFDRYARAVWHQGQRWIRRHWPRIYGPDVTMHDARASLCAVAAIDVVRRLYPQEQQLLSELVYRAWTEAERDLRVETIDAHSAAAG